MKIALVSPNDASLYLFRKDLIRSLIEKGHQVYTISSTGKYINRLERLGSLHISVGFCRFINPLNDLYTIYQLTKIYKKHSFDIVHNFTIKPNIYSSIAAYLSGIKNVYNTIEGLGVLYYEQKATSWRQLTLEKILGSLYRWASKISKKTWFLNKDDIDFFINEKLIDGKKIVLIKSIGIDLIEWKLPPDPGSIRNSVLNNLSIKEDNIIILMVSRTLISKGTIEFIEVARRMNNISSKAMFILVGQTEEESYRSVTKEFLQNCTKQSNFMWLGFREDVKDIITASDICVLPSFYREGVPRSLLEGMALEKPIVTTENVGCREVVDQNINGFKIPIKDVDALERAIISLIEDPALRIKMGKASRIKVEREFDEKYINQQVYSLLYGL